MLGNFPTKKRLASPEFLAPQGIYHARQYSKKLRFQERQKKKEPLRKCLMQSHWCFGINLLAIRLEACSDELE